MIELTPEHISELQKEGLPGVRTSLVDNRDLYTKQEQELLESKALTVEDDPVDTVLATFNAHAIILQPPYHPASLVVMTHENNTLNQCIAAMVVNIEETGFKIVNKVTKEEGIDEEANHLREFFEKPCMDMSFLDVRKKIRRDLESLGYAYCEVVRAANGDIVFINPLDSKLVRLVRRTPDDLAPVIHKINRFGTEYTYKLLKSQRRYVQVIGTKLRYFKEFGAERHVNVHSGEWDDNTPVRGRDLLDNRATEIIEFKIQEDIYTPYGVPRWVNQFPSALGSRMAEELNLDYFKSGGLPPAMVLVQGGALSEQSRKDLTAYLGAKAKHKLRAVLAEVFSTSGDINTAGNVKVTVERFGAERQKDSLFENYDSRSTQRIRTAFRLPPMFIGLNEDYTYSTARISYILAEAQVFNPERQEFDSVINNTLMAALSDKYIFQSNQMTVNDVEGQIEALGMALPTSEPSTWIQEVNRVTHLNLKEGKGPESLRTPPALSTPGAKPKLPKKPKLKKPDVNITAEENIEKFDDVALDAVDDWIKFLEGTQDMSEESYATLGALLKSFDSLTRDLFNKYVGSRLVNPQYDTEGVEELLAHCVEGVERLRAE